MKFAYYTNLVVGILILVFVVLMLLALMSKQNELARTSNLIAIAFFAVMGVMLLVSAAKIKIKMRDDKLAESIAAI